MSGVVVVARWELRRVTGSRAARGVLAGLVAAPFVVAVVLRLLGTTPTDTLFGRWTTTSGWALPMLVLGFLGTWGLPVLAALVGAPLFAGEDAAGTWPLLLGGRRTRSQVYAGKLVAAALLSLLLLVAVGLAATVAGVLVVGTAPLVLLDGTTAGGSAVLGRIFLSYAVAVPELWALTALAVLLAVLTRNLVAGVLAPVLLALLLQVVALAAAGPVRRALVVTTVEAWHGVMRSRLELSSLAVALPVAAVWAGLAAGVAWASFRRRSLS